jgi:hypothetical protein
VRGRASLLLGLAIVAACGHPFDTSVQPDPLDASVEAGMTATDATTPSSEASVGDDDDDAGLADGDATSPTDAGADADAEEDADVVVPPCTSFNETFPNPWAHQTEGWSQPPPQPNFIVTTFAEMQAFSVGNPNATYLTHDVVPNCRAHLKLKLKISDNATTLADVTMIHFGSSVASVDIVRRDTGALEAVYASTSRSIGTFDASTWYTLDIDIPKDGGEVKILLNASAATQTLTMAATPSKITQLQIGVVEIVTTNNVNAVVDVDDIQFNQP